MWLVDFGGLPLLIFSSFVFFVAFLLEFRSVDWFLMSFDCVVWIGFFE